MLTKRQIAERVNYIGCSDMSALMGLNKYTTPYDLWLLKTKRVEPPDLSKNEAVYCGNVLEPVIRKEFVKKHKVKVIVPRKRFYMKDYPYISAKLDGMIGNNEGVLEIKNTSEFNKRDWGEYDNFDLSLLPSDWANLESSDKVPPMPYIQITGQMMVTNIFIGFLSVFIGGNKFRHFKIDYNEKLANVILEKCIEFWEYVKTDTPPPPNINENLTKRYKGKPESTMETNQDISILHDNLIKYKQQIAEINKQKEEAEFKIKKYMAENEAVEDSEGKYLFTWKSSTSQIFNSKLFKKEQVEMYGRYLKETASRRFLCR